MSLFFFSYLVINQSTEEILNFLHQTEPSPNQSKLKDDLEKPLFSTTKY